MDNLMDLVTSQLSGSVMDQIVNSIGGGKKEETKAATQGSLSLIMAAISKNASTPEGQGNLISAIDRDHDGSIFDDLSSLLTGGTQTMKNPRAANGSGILKHILGEGQKKDNSVDMISRMSGLDKSNVTGLMVKLAPLVMGALGKARIQGNVNSSGLTEMLRSTVKSKQNQSAQMSLIERFLDKDGDGSVLDDIAGMGLDSFMKR